VDLEYEAHLADFGIAKMVDPATSLDLSSVAGSVGYIPPGKKLDSFICPWLCLQRVVDFLEIWSLLIIILSCKLAMGDFLYMA